MKKQMLIALLAVLLFNSTSLSASAEQCVFTNVRKLDQGSEISTFVYDFWEYSKKNFPKDFKKFPFVLEADGPAVGDYHFGNVGAYWNERKGAVDVAVIDMDDSGSGNQFGDLIKLLLFAKAKYKEDGLAKLALKFYVQGLDNKDGSLMPEFEKAEGKDKKEEKLKEALADLKKILKQSKDDFAQENQKYVTRKMDGKLFAKKFGLQPLSDLEENRAADEAQGRPEVEKLGKILDTGFQINVSGSSIGAYRFVYLVETNKKIDMKKDGQQPVYLIVELKQNNCAGVVKYESRQSLPAERFESNKVQLQSGEFWKDAKVLNIGKRSYLRRVKQANQIEKLIEEMNKKDVDAYTAFYAYTLGRIHSLKADGGYVTGLSKNVKNEEFVKAVDDYVKAYDTSLASRTKKK